MSITIKNLRPGVLILADARLRLGPGEKTEITALTPQIQKALSAGLLARLDESEPADGPAPSPASSGASEPSAEQTTNAGDGENVSRRGGTSGKRPALDALRRKAEEKAEVKGEESASGAE